MKNALGANGVASQEGWYQNEGYFLGQPKSFSQESKQRPLSSLKSCRKDTGQEQKRE